MGGIERYVLVFAYTDRVGNKSNKSSGASVEGAGGRRGTHRLIQHSKSIVNYYIIVNAKEFHDSF
jgi:hypothetical protein